MDVMKIAVGTTSEQKLRYLHEVLDELNIVAELMPVNVLSGVSDQPISSKETKTGSINRAKNAIAEDDEADIALGIEVGYHPNPNGNYKIFCWATIIDKNDRQISAQSHKLLLPKSHQRVLKEDGYLGDYVEKFHLENPDNLSVEINNIIRYRKPFIQSSLQAVLFEYLFG
jgi:non-canonical (house-cleaning) NTP pyrophosphatase